MDLDPFEPGANDFFWWGYMSFRHISQSREGDSFRKPSLARCKKRQKKVPQREQGEFPFGSRYLHLLESHITLPPGSALGTERFERLCTILRVSKGRFVKAQTEQTVVYGPFEVFLRCLGARE